MVNPPVGMGMGHSYQGANADAMAGWGMNKVANIGAPIASVGMGLAGLDPMSMAFKGGAAGLRFGIGGAIGGAAMGAAVAGVGIGAAQYATEQLYTGAQQQAQLNATMHSNFQFMNQQGGRGFNRTQMANIGSEMRGMVGMDNMGASTGMEELTRLAGNMGSMGMARGVTDVREFTNKLKEMVKNAKTIATELSTSLEEAQQTMSSMRSSGVFRGNDQVKMAGMMRSGSLFGISTAETGAMAQIGSQISRSIGGTGRNGAMAGAKMAVAVGGAVDTGILGEEDIYNATGLTGAEGRQAFGARQLQLTGAFLQSGLGRRMYASVAGESGKLNQSALGQYLNEGGFSTGGTMQHAYGNLNRIGRADFIYNEGKLRGSVMEADPFAAQRSMSGWLQGKGIDMEDPRAKIFMQRRFAQMGIRLSNDELESQMNLMKNLPGIEKQLEERSTLAGENKQKEIHRKNTGLSGVKKRLEEAREHVNNKLQEAGSSMYNELSQSIESFVNQLTGQFVQEFSGEIDKAFKGGTSGGIAGRNLYNRTFGGGKGTVQDRIAGGASGQMGMSSDRVARFNESRLFGSSDADKFSRAGYKTADGREATGDDLKKFEAIDRASKGLGTIDSLKVGSAQKSYLADVMASGDIKGSGMDRVNALHSRVKADAERDAKNIGGNSAAAQVLDILEKGGGDEAGKMQRTVGLLRGANLMSEGMQDVLSAPDATHSGDLGDGARYATAGDRHYALGKGVTGFDGEMSRETAIAKEEELAKRRQIYKEKGALGLIGSAFEGMFNEHKDIQKHGGYLHTLSRGLSQKSTGESTKDKNFSRAVGEYLSSKKGFDLTTRVLGTGEEHQDAMDEVNKQLAELNAIDEKKDRGGDALSQQQAAKREGLKAMRTVGLVNKQMTGEDKMSRDEAIKHVAGQLGLDVREVEGHITGISEATNKMRQENTARQEKRVRDKAKGDISSYLNTGLVEQGDSGLKLSDRARKDLSDHAANYLNEFVLSDAEKNASGEGGLDAAADREASRANVRSKLSAAEKKKMAKEYRGMGVAGKEASILEQEGKTQETLERYQGAGKGFAAAKALGINTKALKGEERKLLSGDNVEGAVNLLMDKQGFGGMDSEAAKKYKEQLASALEVYKKEGAGKGAQALNNLDKSEVQKEKNLQKQKEENPLFDKMAGSLDKMAGILESAFPKQGNGQQNVFVTNIADIGKVAGPAPDGG